MTKTNTNCINRNTTWVQITEQPLTLFNTKNEVDTDKVALLDNLLATSTPFPT